jgi:hypothetical protein
MFPGILPEAGRVTLRPWKSMDAEWSLQEPCQAPDWRNSWRLELAARQNLPSGGKTCRQDLPTRQILPRILNASERMIWERPRIA